MRDVPKQVVDTIAADAMQSPLIQPFHEFPPAISEADRSALTDRAKQIYSSRIIPVYQKFHDYLVSTYIPACRKTLPLARYRTAPGPMPFTFAGKRPRI